MMDCWLIFTLFLPFAEVTLHALLDYLRTLEEEDNLSGKIIFVLSQGLCLSNKVPVLCEFFEPKNIGSKS